MVTSIECAKLLVRGGNLENLCWTHRKGKGISALVLYWDLGWIGYTLKKFHSFPFIKHRRIKNISQQHWLNLHHEAKCIWTPDVWLWRHVHFDQKYQEILADLKVSWGHCCLHFHRGLHFRKIMQIKLMIYEKAKKITVGCHFQFPCRMLSFVTPSWSTMEWKTVQKIDEKADGELTLNCPTANELSTDTQLSCFHHRQWTNHIFYPIISSIQWSQELN